MSPATHVTVYFLIAAFALWFGVGVLLALRRQRGQRYAHALRLAAFLLDADAAALAPCLGVSARDIHCWAIMGVPCEHRDDVERLANEAIALRRRISPSLTLRLLTLRRRRAEAVADEVRQLGMRGSPSVGARPMSITCQARSGVVITTR